MGQVPRGQTAAHRPHRIYFTIPPIRSAASVTAQAPSWAWVPLSSVRPAVRVNRRAPPPLGWSARALRRVSTPVSLPPSCSRAAGSV